MKKIYVVTSYDPELDHTSICVSYTNKVSAIKEKDWFDKEYPNYYHRVEEIELIEN